MLVVNKGDIALEGDEVYFYGIKYMLTIENELTLKRLDDLLEKHKYNNDVFFIFEIKARTHELLNMVVFEESKDFFEVIKNDS